MHKPKLTMLLAGLLLLTGQLTAQDSIAVTSQLTITGKVKKPATFTYRNLRGYVTISIDSITITNHLYQPKGVIRNIKGVLLRDVLDKLVEIDESDPKKLSEYYIECIASDNYKVVFSWNELYNSNAGNLVMIITEKDGKKGEEMEDRICIISPGDYATGRRFVKGLKEVVIRQVD